MEQVIGYQEWHETTEHKTGWEGSEWMFENTFDMINLCEYEIVEILDTDKHYHPILAIFKKV